jgi:hypothetical protein
LTPDLANEIIRPVGGERQLKFVILFDTASMLDAASMRSPRKTGTSSLRRSAAAMEHARRAAPSRCRRMNMPADEYAGG